jgi:tRNA nucleotidyltransferase (CCA-adding enzyme)
MTDALKRLAAAVPANVRDVCATLTAAGFQAVTVGGAVRDALLGRNPGDWDVATSAHPDEVLKLFRHTIPTGLQHGTVTVVTGKGAHTHVEITTFRGEGAYSDARRPDHVIFGVPLIDDLARRDLVVNAMAYDPAKDELIDPFDAQSDIAGRRLRAVGKAVDRFTEDGLRVMRAVRFAAQLEFDLDADTEAGIAPALPSLAMVSRERIHDELSKILDTKQPSRGLAIARRTGIVRTILPVLDTHITDDAEWLGRIDRATHATRLAALLVPLVTADAPVRHVDHPTVKHVLVIMKALTFSNVACDLTSHLVGVAQAPREREWTSIEVRKLLSELGRDKRPHAIELWEAEATPNAALIDKARRVLAERHPLAVGDLAVTGKDVMTALALDPGPIVGRILALLLERVLEDPARNTREFLLAEARQVELELAR